MGWGRRGGGAEMGYLRVTQSHRRVAIDLKLLRDKLLRDTSTKLPSSIWRSSDFERSNVDILSITGGGG